MRTQTMQRPFRRFGLPTLLSALVVAFAATFAATAPLAAEPFFRSYSISFDVTANPGPLVDDGQLYTYSFPLASSYAEDLGLPGAASLDAYVLLADGAQIFSIDIATQLGGVLAEPADLVRLEGGVYSLELDASALGVPAGVNLDAVTFYEGEYLVSFDTTISVTGASGQLLVDDADLVSSDGASFGAIVFDAASVGVPPAADVDAAFAYLDFYYVSFDISGQIGGVDFDDEDLLSVDLVTGDWSMSADLSTVLPLPPGADADAYHYELIEGYIFFDGFESGDTGAWSSVVGGS